VLYSRNADSVSNIISRVRKEISSDGVEGVHNLEKFLFGELFALEGELRLG